MCESEEKPRLPDRRQRLLIRAEQTFGDRELANRWLQQPHPRIWGCCPISLVSGTAEQRKIFEMLLEIDKDVFAANPEPATVSLH